MRLAYTPQLATTVVVVDVSGLPGVLVDKHVTLGVDMALSRLDVGNHFPDAVQLIARQILVDMTSLEDLVVLDLRRAQLVVVVGDEHLALAHQLPVVTIRSAVVQVEVVGGTHAVSSGTWAVVGDLRSATNAALTSVVDPRHTRGCYLVDGLVDQQHVTGQTRRVGYLLFEVIQHLGRTAGLVVLQPFRNSVLLDKTDNVVVAVDLRSGLHHGALEGVTTVAGNVVPDYFQAVSRDREGVGQAVVLQAVAALYQRGVGGIGSSRIVYRLREGSGAMAGEYTHLEGVRVALEHRDLARSQVISVLLIVGGGDHKQRLLTTVGVGQKAIAVDGRGVSRQTAGPGGDGARCVACGFCTDRSQAVAQLGGFLLAHGGEGRRRQQRGGQECRCKMCGFH